MVKSLDAGPLKAPFADGFNEAGGRCYDLSAKHALAQLACTGCMNGTFYLSVEQQLDAVKSMVEKVDPEFVAQVAVYARQKGMMKEMPALLCAWLAHSDLVDGQPTPAMLDRLSLLHEIFDRVIDNGVMLRKFWEYVRSGTFGRRGFGKSIRKLVRQWFSDRHPASVFHQSIGNDPSFADILKFNRPCPETKEKAALYAYLVGGEIGERDGEKVVQTFFIDELGEKKVLREHKFNDLPEVVRQFEAWKLDRSQPMPKLDFRFLDNGKLSTEDWVQIAKNANWMTTLKNLNTFARHKVFDSAEMVGLIAERISDKDRIKESKAFPYQIMTSYNNLSAQVPREIAGAVALALETATANVPKFAGKVHVCLDVSGSMFSPITGYRPGATSVASCTDVASLIAAVLVRNNEDVDVLPFANNVLDIKLDLNDSIPANVAAIRRISGGGTNCSAPLRKLNAENAVGDLVIFLSDYESWLDTVGHRYSDPVAMAQEWERYKFRNPNAKLICVDLTPRTNAQVNQREDILQVGGFSDSVFTVMSKFIEAGWSNDHWIHEIDAHWGRGYK